MAKIGEQQLKEQVKSGAFKNVYLFYGEESYLKEYYVNKLKEKLVAPAFADFNFHQHEGKNSTLEDILTDTEIVPMMSEYSLVLVHDFPFDKNGDVDKLKEFFKDVPEFCVLIFWYDSIELDTKRSSKWSGLVTAFSKAGDAVNLEKRTEGELIKLVMNSAKKRGCSIERQRAQYFISVVGSDIQTIFNELEKICAFVQSGEITKKHIDDLAVKCLQARVYDLSKFILKGNSDGAFGVLNVLFAQKEEPISVLAVISSCYVDMYRVKCAKAAGEQANDIANYFSYKGREFLIQNAARDSANISVQALRASLDVISLADEKMKSTAIDKNLLLEETVAKLLMLRAR